jgi:hypothetical protein
MSRRPGLTCQAWREKDVTTIYQFPVASGYLEIDVDPTDEEMVTA